MASSLTTLANIEQLVGTEELDKAVEAAAKRRKKKAETEIVHTGNQLILPEGISTEQAIELLQRKLEADNQRFSISEFIPGYPYDAAAAFYFAMKDRFGFTCASEYEINTFFGKKKMDPQILQIRTGPKPGDILQIPSGGFLIPGMEEPVIVQLYWSRRSGEMGVQIGGKLRAKDRTTVRELTAASIERLRTQSLYKGKALSLRTNEDGQLDIRAEPEFMDVENVDVDRLILNNSTMDQLRTFLWGPIQNTAACRKDGISLSRTICIPGTYGTGKTLAMLCTAKVCVDNGWTFVTVNRAEGLTEAIEFARRFQPCLVSIEDIDRVTEKRDTMANDLFNTISGLQKDAEVMVIMTTNFLEKIDKAMLRPGRFDAIIKFDPADGDTAIRLLRRTLGTRLDPKADLESVAHLLAGHIPATIDEMGKRALLARIVTGSKTVTLQNVITAANGIKWHADLLLDKKPEELSIEAKAGHAIRELMNGHDQQIAMISKRIEEIHNYVS